VQTIIPLGSGNGGSAARYFTPSDLFLIICWSKNAINMKAHYIALFRGINGKKKDIELTERELGQVTGGKGQVEHITYKLTDVIISGVSPGGSGKD
jgi:hypothetical protein